MENNLGNIDRFIRLILGIVLLVIAFASHLTSGLQSYAVITFGMAFFATSVVSFCPFYALFGLNTSKL
jgi:F0F1-type ATP synthase assembly protein I